MTDSTAIEQSDETLPEQCEEAVATALLSGRSVNTVRREFNLTLDQIDRIIARTWPVDQRARVRMIMTDLGKLDQLISEFHRRSLASQDATAAAYATVVIRALERKHDIAGMSAATQIDLTITPTPTREPSSYQKITEVLLSLKHGRPNGGDGTVPSVAPDDPDPEQP